MQVWEIISAFLAHTSVFWSFWYRSIAHFPEIICHISNVHHCEYIFDIEYEAGINEGSSFTTRFAVSFQGGGSAVVTEEARLYNFQAGTGGDSGCPSEGLFDAFDPIDKRKDISVGKSFYGVDSVWLPLSTTGIPSFRKNIWLGWIKLMTALLIGKLFGIQMFYWCMQKP